VVIETADVILMCPDLSTPPSPSPSVVERCGRCATPVARVRAGLQVEPDDA
jgi:hypothetical protein